MSKYIEASEKEDPEETGSLRPGFAIRIVLGASAWSVVMSAAPCRGPALVNILQMFLELKVVAIFEFLLFVAGFKFLSLGFLE